MMSIRRGAVQKAAAEAIAAVSTVALKRVFRRPAANFPGKVALYVDPAIIAHEAHKLSCGSICVVGTNGKTTVSNLVADALEQAGLRVVCNRTGANLDSGVATSLLHATQADWGVFECDELWLAKILPHLRSDYVLLLNLFRDQLDRCGEIDRIQGSIAGALAASPSTVLLYNGDDPLCCTIANRVPNASLAFGMGEDLGLAQNTVSDANMCQECEGMLRYRYREYGQLGDFYCPSCGFSHPALAFSAQGVHVGSDGLSLDVCLDEVAALAGDANEASAPDAAAPQARGHLEAGASGVYMAYNLLAVCAAACLAGAGMRDVQRAVSAYRPDNGRLQRLSIEGRPVLLNLAKNPTGFNQNLKIVTADVGRKAAAFFINDKEADGHDISWIWDVDFEELATQPDALVFAGGIRSHDVQMRLKYAGVAARLVDGVEDVARAASGLPPEAGIYLIANYTALPSVRADAMRLAKEGLKRGGEAATPAPSMADSAQAAPSFAEAFRERPLRIVHVLPDLLNLYGDGGNVRVLARRCEWRGIPAEVVSARYGDAIDFSRADIVFLGGGPDREQKLASEQLLRVRDDIHAYVEDDGVLLAICGGFQILGPTWVMGTRDVEGLGLLDIQTKRVDGPRLIENIVLDSPVAAHPVVGYENHAGRTYLGDGLRPFGRVVSRTGHGNNDADGADGALYRNVLATYLHGPLLGKNPEVADHLIRKAVERRMGCACELPALDDAVELAANAAMCARLGV